MNNIADIVDGCHSYPGEAWAVLLETLAPEMALSSRRTNTLPAERFIATLHIQNTTTSAAGIEKWGFSELQHRLSELPRKNIVRIEEFHLKAFAVRCVFNSDGATLFGCTIVKKRKKAMKTPPAWDGSLDTLERFNSTPEE